jgi:type II restriction/modification system DNA methylase subunit YeeA
MNTSKLKSYAPAARRDFIKAVTERAHYFGIDAESIEPADVQGDVAIIAGRPFPVKIMSQRDRLIERVQREGFELTMRKIAYTWFNRFMALRYMELHNYLDHGFRVLSNPNGSQTPEILEQAAHVELAGLDRDRVVELKLDGTKDAELYRMLIVAECNTLNRSMPFLFETIDGPSELLLPDNLLHSDSLVRKLVIEIDEENWQHIEIIGWLYQFYISEKKDEVIGKVVKSEDIPAATQLFTPNWIVKYMVQNSLGAQWLATYLDSSLKGQMEYYIEPAEQTDEVRAQLATITPSTLDPEELTLIDPACGSGHILVEAYDLFKAIYLERGYRQRDVAKLILEKNLFGLDIDERAAQMTGFALMMKGRADDRRLFERRVKLNVMALRDSGEWAVLSDQLAEIITDHSSLSTEINELVNLFEHATTFGSLIQVPAGLARKLPALKKLTEATSQDLFVSEAIKRLGLLVQQAELLAAQYDAVVENPPYMGSKSFNLELKSFLQNYYKGYEADVFSAFIDRGLALSKPHGRLGFMTPFVWMFISSHENLRTCLIEKETISSLVHLEYSGFEGATVPICTFTLRKGHVDGEKGCYVRLVNFRGSENQGPKTLEAIQDRGCGWFFEAAQNEYKKIPGNPVAYWVSDLILRSFESGKLLGSLGKLGKGSDTGKNELFIRSWTEVDLAKIDFEMRNDKPHLADKKFYPTHKAGGYRKWFGLNNWVIDWGGDGAAIKAYGRGNIRNRQYYYQRCISWGKITSAEFSIRFVPDGSIADDAAPSAFLPGVEHQALEFLNSKITAVILKVLSPTLNFQVGDVSRLPLVHSNSESEIGANCIRLAVSDWDAYERSWDFQSLPFLTVSTNPTLTLESSYNSWIIQNRDTIAEMKCLEEENNRFFIDAYGLKDELTPNVPIEQITLTVNPAYRYGGKLSEEELWTRFRQDTMQELISYAIGCMMGRYSLDAPGLIYAHSGNEGFDPSRYASFPADDDGIVPVTDMDWFDDDAANRVREFLLAVWGPETLEENLTWLAEILGQKGSETPVETIRRYLSTSFFKDHLQTYKKRPIYWLFSSGKAKAFECLVYLHRYNESTLSRMRNEYVIPLQGKYSARAEYLDNEVKQASSASAQKKLQKELDSIKKKQTELAMFDEELRHYADQRISIDLDDGVKVNYGKFGKLLAEVKAVTGVK